MNRARDLLIVVGPSGVGKSTLIGKLLQDVPHSFGYSVSHTTRDMRVGEVDGVNYHFVSPSQFQQLLERKAFVEHAVVHDTYYGTSVESIKRVLSDNRVCIMDLDLVGARNLRDNTPLRCVIIFVAPPSFEVLESRLRNRGTETESRIKKRLADGREWVSWAESHRDFFDLFVVNDSLDKCYATFRSTVMSTAFGAGPSMVPRVPRLTTTETDNRADIKVAE